MPILYRISTFLFKHAPLITDNGLKYFTGLSNKFHSLKQLSLHFDRCQEISDMGMQYVSEGLKELKALEKLDLNFFE